VRKRLTIHLLLKVTSALTVGSPPQVFSVDAATARDEEGRIYIPSSSIRGSWRTAACYAAYSAGLTCCGTKDPDEISKRHSSLKDDEAVVWNGNKLCHVCAVFGSPGYQGIIVFDDAYPVDEAYTLGIRPGIEIDDYTGTTVRGKLFHTEVIEPGSLFRTAITILDNPQSPGSQLPPCTILRLIIGAADFFEAVGLGKGSARPFIERVEAPDGRTAETPEQAVELTGCSELVSLFRRHWAPPVLETP
jgi:CRISPR/Cas system CSM-associated protein Csm3 (group 7 of RAMP superfamily)